MTVGSERVGDADRFVTDHYARRARLLAGLAMRLGLSTEEAMDVVQEAYLRLWSELSSGTTVREPDAWLARVAYRLAMDQHRLRRRVGELVSRLAPPRLPEPHEALDAAVVWAAVDRLPRRERVTIYLRYQADLTFEEIGGVMDIAPGAARTYASRGLARLRATFVEPSRHV